MFTRYTLKNQRELGGVVHKIQSGNAVPPFIHSVAK